MAPPRKEPIMSTVTASPGAAVTRHRLTRTLLRATASAGALAAAATTACAAVLRGGGVPLAVHGKIPLRSVRDFARKEWPLRGSPADVRRGVVLRSAGGR